MESRRAEEVLVWARGCAGDEIDYGGEGLEVSEQYLKMEKRWNL